MCGLDDPVADGLIGVACVAESLVEDEVHTALDEDGVGAAQGKDVDLMLPTLLIPVGCGVTVDVLVEGIAPGVEGRLFDRGAGRGEREVGRAKLRAVRGDL